MNPTLFTPSSEEIANTSIFKFKRHIETKFGLSFGDYQEFHRWSVEHSPEFWLELTKYFQITFSKEPKNILEQNERLIDSKWFVGAELNFAENLLRYRTDDLAIVSNSEGRDKITLTYNQLYFAVSNLVINLKNILSPDRQSQASTFPSTVIASLMPNIAENVIAMLATSSQGMCWSSASPEFGTGALLERFSQIAPEVIFATDEYQYNGKTYSCIEKIEELANNLPSLKAIILVSYKKIVKDLPTTIPCPTFRFEELIQGQNKEIVFIPKDFNAAQFVLFTSGTTGKPKGIIHGVGGTLLQHIKELALHNNVRQNTSIFFYTTCGWMMWNWLVSSLALGAKVVLYDGSPSYPDFSRLLKLIEEEEIEVFGVGAKYLQSLEKSNTLKNNCQFNLSSLKSVLSTGSPLLPEYFDFVYQYFSSDILLCSMSGGTDIISCFALGNPILPVRKGELQSIGLAMDVQVYNPQGEPIYNEVGELVCINSFPSMPVGFVNDPTKEKYFNAYFNKFPNTWTHGDFAKITPNHGLIIYGRSDTTLNPGGVRIGTAEIYQQVETIEEVLESIAVGKQKNGDELVYLFLVLKDGIILEERLKEKIRNILKLNCSPRHVPNEIYQVKELPKTLNGKISEMAVKCIINELSVKNLDSLLNPHVLEDFKKYL